MIPALFPDGVITFDATGEAAWEGPDARLHPREEALIARAGPKRRREFTLGRHCARRALRELGIEDFPLLADAERMPIWPAGIVGSLSHGGGLTAVAVARRGHILGIGLDVEEAGSLDEQVIERICGKAELKSLEELARSAPDSWARLVFSAKESVYKCLDRPPAAFEPRMIELEWDGSGSRFRAVGTDGVTGVLALRQGWILSGAAGAKW